MPPAHPFDDDKLREECGVFGVVGVTDASNFVALGLHALQHRGQEAGGIVTQDPPQVHVTRVTGAGDTFMAAHIAAELKGHDAASALAQALEAAALYVSGETTI